MNTKTERRFKFQRLMKMDEIQLRIVTKLQHIPLVWFVDAPANRATEPFENRSQFQMLR